MASKRRWSTASWYVALALLIIGVCLIGLAFTRIPVKATSYAKGITRHSQKLDMREIKAIVQDVRKMTERYNTAKQNKLSYLDDRVNRKNEIMRTILQVNDVAEIYNMLGVEDLADIHIEQIRFDPTKLNNIEYVNKLLVKSRNNAEFMYRDLYPIEENILSKNKYY